MCYRCWRWLELVFTRLNMLIDIGSSIFSPVTVCWCGVNMTVIFHKILNPTANLTQLVCWHLSVRCELALKDKTLNIIIAYIYIYIYIYMYMGVYKYNMVVVGAQIIICVHRGKEDKALDKLKYRNEISPNSLSFERQSRWTAMSVMGNKSCLVFIMKHNCQ